VRPPGATSGAGSRDRNRGSAALVIGTVRTGMREAGTGRGLLSVAVGAVVSLAPAAGRAQDPPAAGAAAAGGEVVVTASHLTQAADRDTIDATILAPDAAPAGATLADLLATVSDLQVQRPGGPAGVGSVFLRGAKPNFTLVMVEGVPLNDQTNSRGGSTDVSALNVLGVQRVEVVRGALSSIYGSGAVEGAINLVLQGGAPVPTASVAVEGGSDRDASAAVTLRAPLVAGAGASLAASWADAGRVNEALAAKAAPLDGSDRYGLVVRLARSDSDAFPDESGGPRLSVRRTVEAVRSDSALIGAHERFDLGPGRSLELNGAGSRSDTLDDTPGVAPGVGGATGVPAGTSRDSYVFGRGQAILRLDGGPDWRSLAGLEVQQEQGRDDSRLVYFGKSYPSRYSLSRTTPAAFGETSLDLGRLSVDASVRADRPSGVPGRVTGQASLAYRLAARLELHGGWGYSFKAPSFYSLGNAFVGNPGLRPERAETGEVGLTLGAGRGPRLDASLFRIQYHQLIDLETKPSLRLVNRTAVLSQGGRIAVAAPLLDRGTLTASATYIDTRNQANNERLLELPAWRLASALDWRLWGRLRARLDAAYVGDRLDSAIPTGPQTLPPYSVLNVRLFYPIDARTDLEAGVQNAFDRRYEDAIGFPSPGITGRIAATRRF
jgi:outer membrane cobalamin receptor